MVKLGKVKCQKFYVKHFQIFHFPLHNYYVHLVVSDTGIRTVGTEGAIVHTPSPNIMQCNEQYSCSMQVTALCGTMRYSIYGGTYMYAYLYKVQVQSQLNQHALFPTFFSEVAPFPQYYYCLLQLCDGDIVFIIFQLV